MLFSIFMIFIGLALLIIGADFLVRGASNIAAKFHVPEILIGLTIVALGTSAPELIITITSAQVGATSLILGNAIGSNFCNLLLILGIMGLVRPIKMNEDVKKVHLPVTLFATFLLFFMGIININSNSRFLSRTDGIILVVLFLLYFSYPIFKEIKDIVKSYKENKNKNSNINIFFAIFQIILGVVLLKFGGDFVFDYASNIAMDLNISEIVIGSTIVAIGTAMPELVTSIIAIIRKDTNLAVGNLVGSCVINIFLILGIGAIITPLQFSSKFNLGILLLFISTLVLWIFNFIGKKETITRTKSIFLLLLFSIYIYTLFLEQ